MERFEDQIRDLIKESGVERRLGDKRAEQFYGLPESAVFNPSNLANGAEESKYVTVAGAVLGDFVMVSFSLSLQGIKLLAHVNSPNSVRCTFSNHTGGAIDLAEGTLYIRVLKK